MKKLFRPNLYVALTHYPVVNKNGEIITSAVTNLDLHDIARAARTFGAQAFYVVTPLADQKRLVEKIVSHWTRGFGSTYNPQRRRALEMIHVRESVGQVVEHIAANAGTSPEVTVTCARDVGTRPLMSYEGFRALLQSGKPHLLVFGTAWGLSEPFIAKADHILEPIRGNTGYNHLSVRCAAAIILDRLMGNHNLN